MKQNAWDVFKPASNEFGHWVLIDTVFYDADCDAEYVRTGLIDHDGYDPRIVVRQA